MARGVVVFAESKAEAEEKIREEAPAMRILRSREIDLTGGPPLSTGPPPRQWVVVVERSDPAEEAKLPQDDDPEETTEREARQLFLTMAIDQQMDAVNGRRPPFLQLAPPVDRLIYWPPPLALDASDLEQLLSFVPLRP